VGFLRSSRTSIGIAWDRRSINAVQLSPCRSGWEIVASASIRRQNPAEPLTVDEIERLPGVLDRQGFTGRDVVLAVPGESLLMTMLDLPPPESGAPLDQISRMELASAHKCMPDTLETTFWELPQSVPRRGGAVSAIAVGCRHDDANALLDMFEGAGLKVRALDVQAWAVARAMTSNAPVAPGAGGLTPILNLEWNTGTLVVIQDGVVVFERTLLRAGLRHLHETIVETLGLDADVVDYLLTEVGLSSASTEDASQRALMDAVRERITAYVETISSDLRLSIGYVTKEYDRPAETLSLIGEAAGIYGLAEAIGAQCGLATQIVSPAGLCESKRAGADSPALTTAYGLAQYPRNAA